MEFCYEKISIEMCIFFLGNSYQISVSRRSDQFPCSSIVGLGLGMEKITYSKDFFLINGRLKKTTKLLVNFCFKFCLQ